MDWDREKIVKKVYLSAIVDHARRIKEVAHQLENAKRYNETGVNDELRQAVNRGDISMFDANLTDHELPLSRLQEIEEALSDIESSFTGCYEV